MTKLVEAPEVLAQLAARVVHPAHGGLDVEADVRKFLLWRQ